ncbi:hypothetical protein FACS1894132_07950 [Clostridia bacterium]|nr:hypothetical protein FACS1894132_07950 [Clostridia bacterium]
MKKEKKRKLLYSDSGEYIVKIGNEYIGILNDYGGVASYRAEFIVTKKEALSVKSDEDFRQLIYKHPYKDFVHAREGIFDGLLPTFVFSDYKTYFMSIYEFENQLFITDDPWWKYGYKISLEEKEIAISSPEKAKEILEIAKQREL